MFDAVGHPVDRLKRVAIGSLRDSRLKPGHWRDLTPEEVAGLKRSTAKVGGAIHDKSPEEPRRRSRGSL